MPIRLSTVIVSALLLLPAALHAQPVQGRLVASETQAPVHGGTVHLLSADSQAVSTALTDASGRFTLQAPEPGRYWMLARAPGYETSQTDLFSVGAEGMRLRFVIARPPVVLDTVTAVGVSRLDRLYGGFHQRMRNNSGGRFITGEQIEKWGYVHVTDALRSVSNLELVYVPGGAAARLRHPISLLTSCWTNVYLNGMRVDWQSIQSFSPADIEGIEVYTNGAAPAEFNSSMGAACGVVLFWTKSR
jgi:Carboxypeptidase regulatory-like domain/TonB-dependent Receptor Plug Domain